MNKEYDFGKRSDIDQMFKDMGENGLKQMKEALMQSNIPVVCPKCKSKISAPAGKSVCPICGAEIDLHLDIC